MSVYHTYLSRVKKHGFQKLCLLTVLVTTPRRYDCIIMDCDEVESVCLRCVQRVSFSVCPLGVSLRVPLFTFHTQSILSNA